MKLRRLPVYDLNGQGKQTKRLTKKWYGIFVAFDGHLRRLPLLPDRRASDELARTVDQLNSMRSSGGVLPPDLARAVEDMPAKILKTLAKWRILSTERVSGSKPLIEHVADWKAALLAKGNTVDYANASAAK